MAILAARMAVWPVVALGSRFSGLVAIQPGHTLLATGIYGVVRHPSYLGLLVNSLGWASPFDRPWAWCSRRAWSRRCLLASTQRSDCSARSSAPSTMRTAPGHRG
jgi:protein-S-isoprenylcysteine O-methyltransferase Ste14